MSHIRSNSPQGKDEEDNADGKEPIQMVQFGHEEEESTAPRRGAILEQYRVEKEAQDKWDVVVVGTRMQDSRALLGDESPLHRGRIHIMQDVGASPKDGGEIGSNVLPARPVCGGSSMPRCNAKSRGGA